VKSEELYQSGAYLRSNPSWHVEDSPWKARQIFKMLKKHSLEVATVGEVGCGAGGILAELSRSMPASTQFYGYEISELAFRMCSQWQADNLHFYLADLLETSAISFDLLLAMDVIEHVEDVFGFLRGLKSKGRYKVLHIPLDFHLISLLRPQILPNLRRQVGHLHYFTRETALVLLEDTGYEVLDWFYTAGALELASTTRKMAWLNGPRRFLYRLQPQLAVRLFGGFSILVLAQ
jgi:SAM-dependent methyltransferase